MGEMLVLCQRILFQLYVLNSLSLYMNLMYYVNLMYLQFMKILYLEDAWKAKIWDKQTSGRMGRKRIEMQGAWMSMSSTKQGATF